MSNNKEHTQHPYYDWTVKELRVIKTALQHLPLLWIPTLDVQEQSNIEDIQRLVRGAVLKSLDMTRLPSKEDEKWKIQQFIEDSTQRIASKVGVEKKEPKNPKKKNLRLHWWFELEELEQSILTWLTLYSGILNQLTWISKLSQEEIEKQQGISEERIKGVVELAARKVLWGVSKHHEVLTAIENVTKRVRGLSDIKSWTRLDKLPWEHKREILWNRNFWIWYTLKDIEAISYSGIEKFTIQALRHFLNSLSADDENRQNKIHDIARNIWNVDMVTLEMIIQSEGGYDKVKTID